MKFSFRLSGIKLKVALAVLIVFTALSFRVLNEISSLNLVKVEFRNVVNAGETVKLEIAVANESPYTYRNFSLQLYASCMNLDYNVHKVVGLGSIRFYSTKKFTIILPKPPCTNINVKYSVEAHLTYGLLKIAKSGFIKIDTSITREETVFVVNPLPSKVKRNNVVYITGRLLTKNTKQPVPNAKILVYDYDDGVWDDLLTYGYTDHAGYFKILWVARKVDFPDSDAEIYLVFEGNIKYLPSRWPEKGYYRIFVYEPLYPPPG